MITSINTGSTDTNQTTITNTLANVGTNNLTLSINQLQINKVLAAVSINNSQSIRNT